MTARPTPFIDREIERVEEMGIDAAVEKLWKHDANLKRIRGEHKNTLWARKFLNYTVLGLGALGVKVVQDEILGDVLEVRLPISGYFRDALKEREPVSVPGLGEDIGRHGIDPCDQAILNRGGGLDLGTYSFEEWMNKK
ncbi:hypothetical protein LCGC14_1752460 [marine sediment metagenome]|uniref:Uncharacterized protein n=1 Tax=marine sediment metagenome TaxID=412755 RepID=A0A0F9HQT6_9ZZZZ